MTTVDQVGLVATVVTTVYTCFGMPVQIFKSIQRKSVSGLSLVNTLMMLFTFTSWVVYASLKTPADYYVIISNAPGTICTSIILGLFAAYGREEKRA
jgi:uncharacterized protein with PQ loop repeat